MRKLGVVVSVFVLGAALVGGVASASAGKSPRPIARGGHVSGVARPEARLAGRIHGGRASCTTPGSTNYRADCNSQGYPVNETWLALNGTGLVGGANDYNSYNGNADLGYYTSPDGKTWTDNGPLDLFPEGTNHAAGDPGLLVRATSGTRAASLCSSPSHGTSGASRRNSSTARRTRSTRGPSALPLVL